MQGNTTIERVNEWLKDQDLSAIPAPKAPNQFLNSLPKDNDEKFYTNAIEAVRKAGDADKNITQFVVDNTLIRDGRGAKVQSSRIYNDLESLVNTARAADTIIELEGNDENAEKRNTLRNNVKEYIDQVAGNANAQIDLKSFYGKLVGSMREAGVEGNDKKLLSMLNMAKDMVSLEDKKYNIVTLYEQQDKDAKYTAFAAETLLPGLSEDEVAMYNQIANEGKNGAKVREGEDKFDWYNNQSEFERKIIAKYADTIARDKVIPTQMRTNLLGLRNAYSKATGRVDGKELKVEYEGIHTGTISSHIKGVKNQELANTHLKRVVDLARKGDKTNKVIVVSLNTDAPLLPKAFLPKSSKVDRGAVRQLKKAVENLNNDSVQWANAPMNVFRSFVSPSIKPLEKELKEFGQKLYHVTTNNSTILEQDSNDKQLNTIANYLQGKGGRGKAIKALEEFAGSGDEKQVKALKSAIEARAAMNKGFFARLWSFFTGENINLKVVANMKVLSNAVNTGVMKNQVGDKFKMAEIVEYCASGKDRTGVIETEVERLNNAVENPQIDQENLKSQAIAGHTQYLTKVNAGTPGSEGIKKDTAKALTTDGLYSEEIKNILVKPEASNNKAKKMNEKVEVIKGVQVKENISKAPEKTNEQAQSKIQAQDIKNISEVTERLQQSGVKQANESLTKSKVENLEHQRQSSLGKDNQNQIK